MKKLLITLLVIFITISQTNAWFGLIAETGDLLTNSKWNEFFSQKISRNDIKAGNNITVTESGDDIFINKAIAISVPFISTSTQVEIPAEATTTITLEGENFESGSIVTIASNTVNSVNVISPIEMQVNLTTGSDLGEYDIIVDNHGKLNTLWAGNGEKLIKVVAVEITGNDSIGRKWTNGKIAGTCNDYKNPSNPYTYAGDTGDGIYWIKPDSHKAEFKVYCDMTTDNGGWTRFVDIKGDYSRQNAIDCWLGTNISNANLECFNPNRYFLTVGEILNIDWSGTYFYSLPHTGAALSVASDNGQRKCLGHYDYMTIMRKDTTPESDGSDTSYVRLGRSFCEYGRDPAGRGGSFMNYDPANDFGEDTDAARESNARETKVYFR